MTTQSMVTINETYQWGSLGICKQNDLNTIKNDAKIRFGLNGIIPMLHHCGVDSVGAAPLNNFAQIKSMIDTAAQMHTWLVLNFHQIDNIPEPFHTTPQMFKQILDYVKAKVDNGTITTVTPCQGLGQC